MIGFVRDIFTAGGVVMWPLLAFSLATLTLSLERSLFWLQIERRQKRVTKDILKTYRYSPLEAMGKLKKHLNLPIARIFLEAMELDGASPNQFRLALEGATSGEIPGLKRFNGAFQTIIAVSPLLGLLGTILGLIRSFSAIKIGEMTENATLVTGGISEALVSTATGLTVAIATLLLANVFRSFYRKQIALLQEYGSHLEILYEWHYNQHNEQKGKEVKYASPRQ
ncbi:MotA/TolQ/ExbB proton channel family protein [Spirulina sp. CS-785/01]|uniref:MotA/TolQ/ExbB proton channel family protein n=1 Tax=Spirulina sp. CS-785/01 TaxID=3021716 RepID=UPI00232BB40C|nr:MotA/TolQ/ExbB proton channel family protein [Spirulina sp. CS-785/01]MDB9312292.1 MotA/TolQ/ExbB proton channel family protein [Spirulina sp. CS-785/01]